VIYFNDIREVGIDSSVNKQQLLIQEGDILQVTISTLDPQISALFNPNNIVSSGGVNAQNPIAQGYLVDTKGNIELPMIGKVFVKGKTTEAINEELKIVVSKTLKNAFVSTRLLNFRVSVLGDVARPGSYNIPNERVSILDALSLAGDANLSAVKDDILLIRENEGKKKYVSLDLTDTKTLASPYFYLNNNDVVYVKPGNNRLINNSTTFQLLPTIFGGLSLILVLLTTVFRN
jgi:polysaccharide export outer membrane protein